MTSRIKLGFHKIKTPSTFRPNDLEASRKIFVPYGRYTDNSFFENIVSKCSLDSPDFLKFSNVKPDI